MLWRGNPDILRKKFSIHREQGTYSEVPPRPSLQYKYSSCFVSCEGAAYCPGGQDGKAC